MIRNIYVICIIFFFTSGDNVFALGGHETTGVEIKVIDSETREPLHNISIIFMINKATGLFIDGNFSIISSEIYITNEDGLAVIPRRKVSPLKRNEIIYNTHFYINIDNKTSEINLKNSNLINFFLFNNNINSRSRYLFPNTEYFAAKITIYPRNGERIIYTQFSDDLEVRKRIKERTYFSRKRDDEQIVIELVRRLSEENDDQIMP